MARTAKKEIGIGHNAPEPLTDEQQQALFFQHKAAVVKLKDEIATLTGKLRACYKQAKAEGFTKKDIDFALQLEAANDDEAIEQRRRESMIARWLGHPIGTQPDLFDDTGAMPLAEKAFGEGKRAGMAGEDNSAPYDMSTEAGQQWARGWREGQDAIFKIKELREDNGLIAAAKSAPASDDFDDALEDGDE